MNRRAFCSKAIAAVASGIGLGVAGVAAGERQLRSVYRILVDGKKEKVRMHQLRVGDVVEVEMVEGLSKVIAPPYIAPHYAHEPGYWAVRVDPIYAPTK